MSKTLAVSTQQPEFVSGAHVRWMETDFIDLFSAIHVDNIWAHTQFVIIKVKKTLNPAYVMLYEVNFFWVCVPTGGGQL